MPQLVLVRHGQASFGAADYDVLSELGARQAVATRAALDARGVRPTRVVCGSMRRQLDTAAAWRDYAEIKVDAGWNEYDSADVLGAHGHPGVSLESPDHEAGGAPDSRAFQAVLDEALIAWIGAGNASAARESWPAFESRVRGALTAAASGLDSGQTCLVVSSAGTIAACCVALLGLPAEHLIGFNRVAINAAVTKVAIGSSGVTLVSFNEHGHLEAESLVTYR